MDPAYKKRTKKVPKHLPNCEQAFRMIVVAPSMSGKSYMVNDLLTNKKWGYTKVFDPVCTFIMSPTYETDDSYKDLRKRMRGYEENCVDRLDLELMDKIIERQDEAKRSKKARPTLILIDDLITEISPRKMSTLVELYTRGRHHYISIILTSQQYRRIPTPIRVNADSVVLFVNSMNRFERKAIAEEAPDDAFPDLCDRLFEKDNYNRYDFIFLNFRYDRFNRWYRCFDKKFIIEDA